MRIFLNVANVLDKEMRESRSDAELPVSVSERRAYFEKLQNSADVINTTFRSPKPLGLCRFHTTKNAVTSNRSSLLSYKMINYCGTDTKENVTPPPVENSSVETVPAPTPPAKPKRTFAHDRFLLSQTSISRSPGAVIYDTVYEPPSNGSSNTGSAQRCSTPFATNVCRLSPPSDRVARIQRRLLRAFGVDEPPPLPPKPNLSPVFLKDKPAYFQLSHENEPLVGGLRSKASQHDHWQAGGHLMRYHSDESVYATPVPVKPRKAQQFDVCSITNEAFSCNGQLMPEVKQESMKDSEAGDHSSKHPRLQRVAPIMRRRETKELPVSAVANEAVNARSQLMRAESSEDDTEAINTEKGDHLLVESKLQRRVTRAKLVHRRTLALYDQQVAAFCRRMAPQLFDRALIVKLVPRNQSNGAPYNGISSAYVPHVCFKYPEERGSRRAARNSPVDCADLFIPDFTRARPYRATERWPGNEEFMLTLTDEFGKRTFAYCIKYLPKKRGANAEEASTSTDGILPEVFAIISPIHAPSFYNALARECINYLSEEKKTLRNLLDAVFRRPFPTNGETLRVVERTGLVIKKDIVITSQGPVLGRTGCSAMVLRMGVEVTVSIIAALLAEQKVLIGGESVQSVCHAVQSLASLLQPFSWPYTLVPVLPDTLLELANSPTPYLLGVLRNNLYKLRDLLVGDSNSNAEDLMQGDLVIVDVDGGIFVPQPTELYIACQHADYKEKSALALCEKLLMPRKLALNLISSFKEAVAGGPGPVADELLQKAMIAWFASLIGHYKSCGLQSAYLAELNGDPEPLRIAMTQLITSHTSKSARRFTQWFVETGVFRDWARNRANKSADGNDRSVACSEDAANQQLDELALTLAPHLPHRKSNIFSRAHAAIFRPHLLKKF